MRGTRIGAAVIAVGLAGLTTGCAGMDAARYVYQDGGYGVIGIPDNTDHWPTYYRDQAEALMARHFPGGFEVVRAEEVVEGSRTLTTNGKNTAEIGASGGLPVLKTITLGRTSSRNQADQLKIKECRILYKRVEHADLPSHQGADFGFTPDPTSSPSLYLDPNAEARLKPPSKPGDPKPVVAKSNPSVPHDGSKPAEKLAAEVTEPDS